MELRDKTYLGDGVYAAHDGYHIWLWTSDGITDSKPIALEPSVINSLLNYRTWLLGRAETARSSTHPEEGTP